MQLNNAIWHIFVYLIRQSLPSSYNVWDLPSLKKNSSNMSDLLDATSPLFSPWTMRSIPCHITPLVINSLGGTHTCIYTYNPVLPRQKHF